MDLGDQIVGRNGDDYIKRSPVFCGAGLPSSSAFALILAANEPCLFN